MKNTITIMFLLFITHSFSQDSESEATWEETIQWINTKLNFSELNSEKHPQVPEIKDNIIKVYYVKSNGSEAKVINLFELREASSHYDMHFHDGHSLILEFSDKVEHHYFDYKGDRQLSYRSDIKLYFSDRDIEKRVEKAFNHLALLAKKKRENEASKEKF